MRVARVSAAVPPDRSCHNVSQLGSALIRYSPILSETFISDSVTVMDNFLYRISDSFGYGYGAP